MIDPQSTRYMYLYCGTRCRNKSPIAKDDLVISGLPTLVGLLIPGSLLLPKPGVLQMIRNLFEASLDMEVIVLFKRPNGSFEYAGQT